MRTLTVDLPKREYDIHIGGGVLKEAGNLLSSLFDGGKAAIISDGNVFKLYGAILTDSLIKNGFQPFSIILPPGEQTKSMQSLEHIYNALLEGGLKRTQPIVALGGGVIGDIAGLAAATFMRGTPFIQIPTTLLAQVDSSVGGKVAVNLSSAKNMVGAFYQPRMVISDTDVLESLSEREFSSGMAEVIKYSAISGTNLMELLENAENRSGAMLSIDSVVHKCCDIKRGIVVVDEYDRGGRMILNYGHTFGHALEKLGNYEKFTHGEAVSIGMAMASDIGEAFGVSEKGVSSRIKSLLGSFGLPIDTDFTKRDMLPIMKSDKKNEDDLITLILLKEIGMPVIQKYTSGEIINGQL